MPVLDKSRIAYRHNGHTVRLAAPRVPAPLDLDVAMIGGRTYATITTNSTGVYDLTATTWGADPPVGPYSQTRMTGPEAVYVPSGQSTRITARVPFLGGGFRSISTDVITGSVGYLPDVQMHTIVRGPIDVPIETQRGFTTARTCPARLWRTATGALGTSTPERTLIHEAQVTFPAGEAVKLTHPVPHPAATGYGAGYEYEWEVEVEEGHTISSRPLAIWVIGDAPECAPADPDTVPTFKVPDIYRRPATSYGQVTPPAGKTYQDCLNALQNQWKGTGTANLPGAWINFNQYNMAAIFVDLDDPTVPRYDIEHLDYRNWGYTPPGWYGTDTNTEPWPRSNIARDVPIPHNARVAHGTDRSITIVGMRGGQIERIWEMWIAGRRADGTWTSETLGVTTPAERYQHSRAYTVTASGICHMTGSLMLGETKRAVDYIRAERAAGRTPSKSHIVSIIDHPLGVAMPNPRDGVISYPATFTDGTNPDPATPAEGQMIYLRPDLDIDALGLTPLKYAIAVVMQARGCYVTDRTNWNTSLMVEGDITYTGAEWASVRDPGEDWYIVYPDDAWVIGKVYPDRESFDADTPASTPLLPAEVLDLAAWKVTLPVDSAGQLGNDRLAVEVKQPALATYSDAYIKAAPDNTGVLFTAPVEGATTSGSEYPRCELREMRSAAENTANASWGFDDGGTHTMTIIQAVLELPVAKPQLACGQIHDASDDNLIILADGFAPTTGTTAATGTSTIPYAIRWKWDGATQPDPLIPDYVTGQIFTVKVEVRDNVMRIWADKGTAAYTLRATKAGLVSTFPASSSSGCYFKAGVYAQSNTTNAGKTRPSALGGGPTGGDAPGVKAAVAVHSITVNHA